MDPETLGCLGAFLQAPVYVLSLFLAMGAFALVFLSLPHASLWLSVPLAALVMAPILVGGLCLQTRLAQWLQTRGPGEKPASDQQDPLQDR